MWDWVDSGSWGWTGRPGVLRFMGSQRVGHDWATELNWLNWTLIPVLVTILLHVTNKHWIETNWSKIKFLKFIGKMLLLLLLLSCFSRVQLCAIPLMEANQAPPSLGFSRQEYWSGLPFPSPMHEMKNESEVTQLCPTLSYPMDYSLPDSRCPWDFPGKSTGVGCHCLLCGKILLLLLLSCFSRVRLCVTP